MNKRLIAEEELKRALLMMKYDSRKTLTENIEEQNYDPSNEAGPAKVGNTANTVTDQDLMGDTGALRSYLQSVWGDYNIFDSMGINQMNILAGRRVGVKGVVDALDGWVDESDLAYVLGVVGGLKGKCYMDDSQMPPVKKPAIERFLELYLEDEGESLIDDVNSVGTSTLRTGSEKIKQTIVNTISTLQSQKCDEVQPSPEGCPAGQVKDANGKCVKKGGGGGGGKTGGGSYKTCTGTYTQGCKAEAIKKVQGCLGLVADGKFGPKTQKALTAKGFTGGFTDADVDKICKVQASPEPQKDAIDMSVDTGSNVADDNIAP